MRLRLLRNLGFRDDDQVGREGFETLLHSTLHKLNGGLGEAGLECFPLTTSSLITKY